MLTDSIKNNSFLLNFKGLILRDHSWLCQIDLRLLQRLTHDALIISMKYWKKYWKYEENKELD